MKGQYSREEERLALQVRLDNLKTQIERNRLGQFSTPPDLARDIVSHSLQLLPATTPIQFLDPAIGTGAFFSALRAMVSPNRIKSSEGFEIDPHYGAPAQSLWSDEHLTIRLTDFTKAQPPISETDRFNLVICNPPYVRHHHLISDEKARLQRLAHQTAGVRLSGLAGLYCYFLALAHVWMTKSGVAAWLIPSEFMDVNYGKAIKHYLLHRVHLIRIHRFEPVNVQFKDALVSSAVVWFYNEAPRHDHEVEFTFGGSIPTPKMSKMIPANALDFESKWTRFPLSDVRRTKQGMTLGDLFVIKRGIATGSNAFFILTKERIEQLNLPKECFRPILPSPRYVLNDEVLADVTGNPLMEHTLFLLDCHLPEEEIKQKYPTLWDYLQNGKLDIANRYLCRHRKPWYAQEARPPTPFICTYIGRSNTKNSRPFRFILNHSKATAANVYLLLYPKDALAKELIRNTSLVRKVWQALNQIASQTLLDEGRVYGGGLHKMEPNELAQIPADSLMALVSDLNASATRQMSLFEFSDTHTA